MICRLLHLVCSVHVSAQASLSASQQQDTAANVRTFQDVSDFLVCMHVFLEEGLDLVLVVGQLVRGHCDDVLQKQTTSTVGGIGRLVVVIARFGAVQVNICVKEYGETSEDTGKCECSSCEEMEEDGGSESTRLASYHTCRFPAPTKSCSKVQSSVSWRAETNPTEQQHSLNFRILSSYTKSERFPIPSTKSISSLEPHARHAASTSKLVLCCLQ